MSQANGSWWNVIPRTAKIIAAVLYVIAFPLIRFGLETDQDMRQWLAWQKMLFSLGIPFVGALCILLLGFVYGDGKRRGMRYAMWTVIAALMPYALGIILYFVVREPLLVPCPTCQTRAQRGFAFCPKCGTALTRFCTKCGRAVEPGWSHCAYCGASQGTSTGQLPPA